MGWEPEGRAERGVTLCSGWWQSAGDIRREELGFAAEEAGALRYRWGSGQPLHVGRGSQKKPIPCGTLSAWHRDCLPMWGCQ